MEEIRVFLLDLNVPSGLGSALREILESSPKPRIALQEKPTEIGQSPSFLEISRTLSHFDPNLIFFVLPPKCPQRTKELIRFLSGNPSQPPIMVVMEADEPEDMIELLKLGVVDFIIPPLKKMDVLPRLWRLLEKKKPDEVLVSFLKERIGLQQMVGQDPAFLAETNKIPLVAGCDVSVLILGETGTGKELCARAIHYLSHRAAKPFVPVNCGAIPTELVENELFGHMKGAFTGASQAYPGLIHEANGGTLFLDEIDCLPLPAQVKLLRFLQDKEYRQLGSTRVHCADVRIIAASNIDLTKALTEGKFRSDLYYRLNVISLTLPPLHNRKADIPLLARHFLDKYAAEFNKPAQDLSPGAYQKLLLHDWPGNIRELENLVERAVVFCQQTVIQASDILLPQAEAGEAGESFQAAKSRMIAKFEKNYIQDILRANRGNITKAAQASQKNRRAFWELIRKYKIDVRNFRFPLPHKSDNLEPE